MTMDPPPGPVQRVRALRWSIIAPIALLVAVIALALWFDGTTGGDAKPPPLIGALGTPVRGTFVPSTPTPFGAGPTPRPRPTAPGSTTGTPDERDAQRRADVLVIFDGLLRIRESDGTFPSTNNNIQSLCVYRDVDVGCELDDVLGKTPPGDPLGEPQLNGYWYQSDGTTAKLYVSLEGDIDDAERCDTDYVDFEDDPNMICPTIP